MGKRAIVFSTLIASLMARPPKEGPPPPTQEAFQVSFQGQSSYKVVRDRDWVARRRQPRYSGGTKPAPARTGAPAMTLSSPAALGSITEEPVHVHVPRKKPTPHERQT